MPADIIQPSKGHERHGEFLQPASDRVHVLHGAEYFAKQVGQLYISDEVLNEAPKPENLAAQFPDVDKQLNDAARALIPASEDVQAFAAEQGQPAQSEALDIEQVMRTVAEAHEQHEARSEGSDD